MIENFVNKMTLNDVLKYAKTYGIILSENEGKILLNTIKNEWHTIIYGNYKSVLNNLKNQVNSDTIAKLEKLLIEYKKKYYNYL